MAETHEKTITLINGEAAAIEPYRRVKYDGSNAGYVVYADASDGDSWIGVTLPALGDKPSNGEPVAVALRAENVTLKVECSAAVTANASIYPENDGKISDDAGTVVIGTAAGTATGSGSGAIVAIHPNAGSGSAPDEEAVADADGTTEASLGILLAKYGVTASGSTEIPRPARKLRPVLAWAALRNSTTAADVKLLDHETDICAVVTHDTADENQLFHLNDASTEIAAASTLNVNLSATVTAPGVDVFVLCQPVP